jgi:hypothetical protein
MFYISHLSTISACKKSICLILYIRQTDVNIYQIIGFVTALYIYDRNVKVPVFSKEMMLFCSVSF